MKESVLTRNQKKEIRLEVGDFTLYNPTPEQTEIISNLLAGQVKVDDNLNATGQIDATLIRYMLKELTSVGDAVELYTDAELAELLMGGNRDLTAIFRELRKIVDEMIEDLQYKQYELIVSMNKMIETARGAKAMDNFIKGLDGILEDNGLDIKAEEILELSSDQEALKKRLDEAAKEKSIKDRIEPKDFKKSNKNNNKKRKNNKNKYGKNTKKPKTN